MNLENIRATMTVYGNVQKYDYRGRVMAIARSMNITGVAQNLSNGSVKIIAEKVRQMKGLTVLPNYLKN